MHKIMPTYPNIERYHAYKQRIIDYGSSVECWDARTRGGHTAGRLRGFEYNTSNGRSTARAPRRVIGQPERRNREHLLPEAGSIAKGRRSGQNRTGSGR